MLGFSWTREEKMEVCVELMVLVVVVGGGIPSISNSKDIKAQTPASQIRIFQVGVSTLSVFVVTGRFPYFQRASKSTGAFLFGP